MPEILRFELNVPVEVALQGEGGITVAGRFGDRVMYTLSDNRRMYVAPFVAGRIRELGIQPGEVFRICKHEAKDGHRKVINWLVERLEAKTELERELEESIEIANGRRVLMPSTGTEPVSEIPPEPAPKNSSATVTNGSLNGHDGSRPPGLTESVPETQLAHALKTAIAAAADAEKFAKALDYGIRFTTEDIRSMGITILIGMQQRIPR